IRQISSTFICSGCWATAIRRIPGGASAASCAACPGVTWRGLGANTKPIASTLASAAAATASAVVKPQILIHMARSLAGLKRGRPRGAENIRDQPRADQSQAIALFCERRGRFRRSHAALGDRGPAFGHFWRELRETLRYDCQGLQVAAIEADQRHARVRGELRRQLARKREVLGIEGL